MSAQHIVSASVPTAAAPDLCEAQQMLDGLPWPDPRSSEVTPQTTPRLPWKSPPIWQEKMDREGRATGEADTHGSDPLTAPRIRSDSTGSAQMPADQVCWLDSSPIVLGKDQNLQEASVRFALRPSCRWSGCAERTVYVAQMLCRSHYHRAYRMLRSPSGRATDGRGAPLQDLVGYFGAHTRVRDRFGLASLYCCELCPDRAGEWALLPSVTPLLCPITGLRYSLDPEDYVPLCVSCHKRLDRRNPPRPGHLALPLGGDLHPVVRRELWGGAGRGTA